MPSKLHNPPTATPLTPRMCYKAITGSGPSYLFNYCTFTVLSVLSTLIRITNAQTPRLQVQNPWLSHFLILQLPHQEQFSPRHQALCYSLFLQNETQDISLYQIFHLANTALHPSLYSVCVWVWVSVSVSEYECVCVCALVCERECACVCVCMHACVRACVCVCVHACVCVCVHECVCVHVCEHARTRVCMGVCVCACVHVYDSTLPKCVYFLQSSVHFLSTYRSLMFIKASPVW